MNYFSSFVTQAIYIWLPGRQPFQFYLCSSQIRDGLEHVPFKKNWASIIVLLLSIILYTVANLRIKYFKVKQRQTVEPLQHLGENQFVNIDFVENRSLSDYVTSACSILGISAFLGTLIGINGPNPTTFILVSYKLTKYNIFKHQDF